MKKFIICLFLIFLWGCNEKQFSKNYQIVASTSGGAYKLNVSTGEVWLITPNGLTKLQESKEITLIVGNYYKAEDGETLIYHGKAQLEYWQPKTAKEYLERHNVP